MTTEREWLQLALKASAGVDGGRWQLAEIAACMRDAKIDNWAAKLGTLPNVRRAERTMREWSQVADFRQSCRRKFKLPFSFYAVVSRFADRIELTVLEDALEVCEGEAGMTHEAFAAQLRDMGGMTPEGPDLERTLADLTRLRDRLGVIGKRAGLPTDVYYALTAASEALTPAFEAFAVRLYADGEAAMA